MYRAGQLVEKATQQGLMPAFLGHLATPSVCCVGIPQRAALRPAAALWGAGCLAARCRSRNCCLCAWGEGCARGCCCWRCLLAAWGAPRCCLVDGPQLDLRAGWGWVGEWGGGSWISKEQIQRVLHMAGSPPSAGPEPFGGRHIVTCEQSLLPQQAPSQV